MPRLDFWVFASTYTFYKDSGFIADYWVHLQMEIHLGRRTRKMT
jgi:hypothetical protein